MEYQNSGPSGTLTSGPIYNFGAQRAFPVNVDTAECGKRGKSGHSCQARENV